MAKPMPPKIAPKPGQVKVVRAMYAYAAQHEDELSFNEGDVLYITEQITNPDWWKARCGTKTGLIPSNYARRGNLEFLQECLRAGVSATGLDASGNSPLHWAARGGHLECAQEIIKTALVAFRDTRKFLSTQNKLGDTPLHCASTKDHAEIVKLLLEEGADPFVKNKDGDTAESLAHNPEVKAVLQNAMILDWNENAGDDYQSNSEDEEAS